MTTTHPAVVRRSSRRGLRYGLHDGSGPAVVLVHGWCLNRQVWMYLEQALVTAGRTVITPDLAGYGESGGLAPRTSLADHASDLTDLLDELDVERAVLVGFAFGAGVICSAEDYRRVGALVSVAIPSAGTAPYDRMRGSILKDWPRFAARSAQAIVPPETSAETKDWLSRMFGATGLASALAGLDILQSFEPRDMVKRWDVPAYFVHGSGDPIVPAAISKECAEHFGGEYLEVSSPAHLVVIDQKEAVFRIVADLVAAVLPGELAGFRAGSPRRPARPGSPRREPAPPRPPHPLPTPQAPRAGVVPQRHGCRILVGLPTTLPQPRCSSPSPTGLSGNG
jgi:pimeloyl-ACP methyl ester carboxylesterase